VVRILKIIEWGGGVREREWKKGKGRNKENK
jgi:hypothetical protein